MADINIKKAQIYVSTYLKYSCGSLKGKWFYLADYDSKEAFEQAIKEYHKDEQDPEFMFQDFSDIPQSFFSESHISADFWELLHAVNDLNEEELDAFNIWANLKEYDIEYYMQKGYDIKERFFDSWRGKYETMTHYAIDYLEESGYFDCITDKKQRNEIEMFFDYEKYAESLLMNDYYDYDDKHVFLNLDRGSN